MNRLVLDRRDTCGILLDSNGDLILKPLNWMKLIDDDLNSIPFIKECLDDGCHIIEFEPLEIETGTIVARKPNGFFFVIGFWKELTT